MKIYRPLWTDGAFLAPQQFQQQARWDAWVADSVARMSIASPWGVVDVAFDQGALVVSRLHPVKMVVRFADGTMFDSEQADNLPPAVDLNELDGRSHVDVVLALPLLNASGGNLDEGGEGERPRRWKREWISVQELAGYERTELAVLRNAATLRFAHQENDAWLTCPVARLVRNAQGIWEFDNTFIPPMLTMSASPWLLGAVTELLHRVRARRQRLMNMRRESNARMADFAVADVSLFWLLNSLNSAEPVLRELLQNPGRHPELLWRELARLAGGLLTFSLERDGDAIPLYRHEAPEHVFPPLVTLLFELLETGLPSRVITIDLTREGSFWRGDLHDSRLREDADFYLSVRSSLPAHLLQTQFPLLCKAGSREEVADVVNVALSGVPLKPLSHVPAAIPLRLENQYFALDVATAAGKSMLDAGNCAFYVPGSLGEVQLELFAVLRT